jgi:hypothetical protein
MHLTEYHPIFALAVILAVLSALALQGAGVPAPWPAAIAMYVYGVAVWPVLRERVPSLSPGTYAAAWTSIALLVIVFETLARLVHIVG